MRFVMLVLLGLGACTPPDEVVFGSKDFSENRLLAEAMALMAEDAGVPVKRRIPFGGTFACEAAIKAGELHVYPEYTGTALVLLGINHGQDADATYLAAAEAWADRGIRWGDRLGFDNSWAITTTTAVAAREQLRTLTDLTRSPRSWRIGVMEEYLHRPLDGIDGLERTYGLSPTHPVVFATDEERYLALLEGRVDLVVGSETDPWIDALDLVELDDDLGFFPPYEPASVVSEDAVRRHPGLADALNTLGGKLDRPMVRTALQAMMLEGVPRRVAAARLLADAGLRELEPEGAASAPLIVSIPQHFEGIPMVTRALAAVHRSVGGRVEAEDRPDPLAGGGFGLIDGLALHEQRDGRSRPRDGVEALAPVGWLTAHLVVGNEGPAAWAQLARIGVGHEGGPGARLAALLHSELGGPAAVHGDLDAQLEQVRAGELDGVFLVDELGHTAASRALQGGTTRLAAIPWPTASAAHHPFLRPARIPRTAYDLGELVPTVAMQVVIATANPDTLDPAATARLREALPGPLDPALPTREVPHAAEPPAPSLNAAGGSAAVLFLLLLALWGLAKR